MSGFWALVAREGHQGKHPVSGHVSPPIPRSPTSSSLPVDYQELRQLSKVFKATTACFLRLQEKQAYISHTYTNTSAYFLLVYEVTRQGPKLSFIFKMLLFKELPFIAIMGMPEQTTLKGGLQNEERILWIFYLESLKTKLSGISILRQ